MVIWPHGIFVDFDETVTIILCWLNFIEPLAGDYRPNHFLAAHGQGDITVLVTSHPPTPHLRLIAMDFWFIEVEDACAGIEEVQEMSCFESLRTGFMASNAAGLSPIVRCRRTHRFES